jgi:acyl carrier protein/predicted DNA-binding antitoxin AbrB/MazE fold protein
MTKTLEAVFDGEVLRPDEPIDLEPNTRVRITIETPGQSGKSNSFLRTARSLNLQGPADWASRLDDYLHGGEGAAGSDGSAFPRPALGDEYVAPRSEVENMLAELWRTLLEVERVGVHDNFFELGGDSLLVVKLCSRIRETFAVELSITDIFESPTVAELSAKISERRGPIPEAGARTGASAPAVRAREEKTRRE